MFKNKQKTTDAISQLAVGIGMFQLER